MPDKLKEAGVNLVNWYQRNKRDLPWRHTKDPYKIWISEIMLQQTRVDTVIDYYLRFLQRFPDIESLAKAREEEVLLAWKGLGYYSRAKNLQKAAIKVMQQHSGRFPSIYEDVRALPGIGDYTAGAILSIAFNQPFPAVDGNVLRVVSRLQGLEEDISKEKTKKVVAAFVSEMIPGENPADFSQSVMELGALVCIPAEPLCSQCPVNDMCSAYLTGRQKVLPIKKKNDKPVKRYLYWAAVVRSEAGILMEFRSHETLLGGMWGTPIVEKDENFSPEELFASKYGLKIKKEERLGIAKHVFTHQVWEMEAIKYCIFQSELPQTLRWISEKDMDELAIPTAFQRVLDLYKKNKE